MQKLSLNELQERAGEITTVELMSQILGGTDNDCHPNPVDEDGVDKVKLNEVS